MLSIIIFFKKKIIAFDFLCRNGTEEKKYNSNTQIARHHYIFYRRSHSASISLQSYPRTPLITIVQMRGMKLFCSLRRLRVIDVIWYMQKRKYHSPKRKNSDKKWCEDRKGSAKSMAFRPQRWSFSSQKTPPNPKAFSIVFGAKRFFN